MPGFLMVFGYQTPEGKYHIQVRFASSQYDRHSEEGANG
jgi:hypothetical protein